MRDYLELTVDKFKFKVATDRVYTEDGLWAFWMQLQQDNRVRIGLTDYLQQHNGDVTFISVKPVGTMLNAGDEFADFETIKEILVLPAPVSGTVVEINPALEMTPEIINQDPYDTGWLAVIETTNWEADRLNLLDPQAYFSVMKSEVEKEIEN